MLYLMFFQDTTQDDQSSSTLHLEPQEESLNDNEENQNADTDMELDLLAESESDSDDSNAEDVVDSQRSGAGNGAQRSQTPEMLGSRGQENDGTHYYSGNDSINDEDGEDAEIEEDDDVNDSQLEPIVQRLISGLLKITSLFTYRNP